MDAEINSLLNYGCFEFHPAGYALPDDEYQKMTLRCIFAIKHDLRRKSRLVAGRHLLNVSTDVQIYSSQVKPIIIKLVSVIADKMGLKQLCGNVSNASVMRMLNPHRKLMFLRPDMNLVHGKA